jgi:hypothetical protein
MGYEQEVVDALKTGSNQKYSPSPGNSPGIKKPGTYYNSTFQVKISCRGRGRTSTEQLVVAQS